MHGSAVRSTRVEPGAETACVVAALLVDECDRDVPLVSIPRPETHLVVRFGPSARGGLDVHAMGAQQRVRRKVIRAGQRTLMVRLCLGAPEAVLGVPASAIAGSVVPLDELWGEAAARRLIDRLSAARATVEAAGIVEHAIVERLAAVDARHAPSQLALRAAERLARSSVRAVAVDLGVSERHLRRVFRDAIGVSPKAFARLARFHRALGAARGDRRSRWASIAAATGYYDQAHLIGEFRAIAGVTPRALVGELAGLRVEPTIRRPARSAARRI